MTVGDEQDSRSSQPGSEVDDTGSVVNAGRLALPGRDVLTGSLRWSLAGQLGVRGLTFLTGIVLARIFTPGQFGEYAVALTALAILLSLNDIGISATLTRWPGNIRTVAPTAVTLTMVTSGLLTALAWLVAGPYARLFHAPGATQAVRVMTLLVLIDGIAGPANAFLSREFRQRARVTSQIVGSLVGLPVTIALAGTYGAVAISTGQLIGGVTTTIICLVCSPYRPRPGWDSQAARDLLSASAPVAAAAIAATAVLNTDYVVVGSRLGPTQLGVYVLAWQISNWPSNLITAAVQPVASPALASLGQQPGRRAVLFRRALELLGIGTSLVVVPIAFAAPVIIETLYGTRWLAASGPLTLLMAFAFCRVVTAFLGDAMLAAGHAGRLLFQQALWLAALAPVALVAADLDGIRGVAVAQLLVGGLLMLPLSVQLGAPATALPRSVLLSVLARVLLRVAPVAVLGTVILFVTGGALAPTLVISAISFVILVLLSGPRLRLLLPARGLRGTSTAGRT